MFKKGVWLHPARDITDADSLNRTIDKLRQGGFDFIVYQVRSSEGYMACECGGFKKNPLFRDFDPLEETVKALKKLGVEIHVWFTDFLDRLYLTGHPDSALIGFGGAEPVAKNGPWICPSRNDVIEYQLAQRKVVLENYEIDGIHFDYIRYPYHSVSDPEKGRVGCICRNCREIFSTKYGVDPLDITLHHELWGEWVNWCVNNITSFVEKVTSLTRRVKPHAQVSAAVKPYYPYSIFQNGQDWVDWCRRGLLDFVAPMSYTNHTSFLGKLTELHRRYIEESLPLYEGIGAFSSVSSLTPSMLKQQIETVKSYEADGVVIFHFNKLSEEHLDVINSS